MRGGKVDRRKKRKGKKEKEKCKMKFKIIIFEFIVRHEIVKSFRNLILCRVNNLNVIRFNKKFSFLIFKRTWH